MHAYLPSLAIEAYREVTPRRRNAGSSVSTSGTVPNNPRDARCSSSGSSSSGSMESSSRIAVSTSVASKPVAITVTFTSSPRLSSIAAPNTISASGCTVS